MNKKSSSLASIGAMGSAVLASSCCWLPLVLLAVGASAATLTSMTTTLAAYRPVFIGAAVILLGAAWYLTYFRRAAVSMPASTGGESCSAPVPSETCCPPVRGVAKIERFNRYALPLLTVAVLAVTIFPEKVLALLAPPSTVASAAPGREGRWFLLRSEDGRFPTERTLRGIPGVAEIRSFPENRAHLIRVAPGSTPIQWPEEVENARPAEVGLFTLRVPGMT